MIDNTACGKLVQSKVLEDFTFVHLCKVIYLKSLTLFGRVSRGKWACRKFWYHLPDLFRIRIVFLPKSTYSAAYWAMPSCSHRLLSVCFSHDPVSCPAVVPHSLTG